MREEREREERQDAERRERKYRGECLNSNSKRVGVYMRGNWLQGDCLKEVFIGICAAQLE